MNSDNKYIDQIYEFKGQWGVPSKCGLKIYQKDDTIIAIATELYEENPGTSITYESAQLATELCKKYNVEHNKLIFIERTQERKSKLTFYNEKFFLVRYDWDGERFINPKWKQISKEDIDKLINYEAQHLLPNILHKFQ